MSYIKFGFAVTSLLWVIGVSGQTLEDESVSWLQDFIRIDTINPPGNESRAVDFYAEIFEAEGY